LQSDDKSDDGRSLEELVNAAADMLDAGDPERAMALSRRAIDLNPDCAEAWSNLSFAGIQLNDLKTAEQAALKAVSLAPYLAGGWHNLGEIYLRLGQPDRSLEYNNRALSIDPGPAVYWLGRGTALSALERLTEAVACFDKALSINPRLPGARINREVTFLRSQPERRTLLLTALGIAAQLQDGKMTYEHAGATAKALFRPHPDFDADLVRSFDYFAQLNIRMGKPVIVCFCQVNFMLAASLGDMALIELCRGTLAEAKSKLG
jgi:tetratricopeptide (TPR) repeat protein